MRTEKLDLLAEFWDHFCATVCMGLLAIFIAPILKFIFSLLASFQWGQFFGVVSFTQIYLLIFCTGAALIWFGYIISFVLEIKDRRKEKIHRRKVDKDEELQRFINLCKKS